MDFHSLRLRLIAHVQSRLRNGEITERGLARLSGISQPHMHNLLNGTRVLRPEMADQILRCLRIDLLDLLGEGEPGATRHASRSTAPYRTVPLLDGWIGPGYPYPAERAGEGYPFLAEHLDGVEHPVAVRLAPDPSLAGLADGAVALLDRSPAYRQDPDEDSYCAADLGGESAIRRVRRGARSLYLFAGSAAEEACPWQCISLLDGSLPQIVRGRVRLVVRRLDTD
jgi:hypothetical protein